MWYAAATMPCNASIVRIAGLYGSIIMQCHTVSAMHNRNAMVEARIKLLPDYIEAESSFLEERSSLDFLSHNLFEGVDWFDSLAQLARNDSGNLSADEAATEAEIDSGAEDASGLRAECKTIKRRLSVVFE